MSVYTDIYIHTHTHARARVRAVILKIFIWDGREKCWMWCETF